MKHSLISFVAIVCIYTSQCPEGQQCAVDSGGFGQCEPGAAGGEMITHKPNQRCTFPSDCADNEICTRPNGYKDYGVCKPGSRGNE